MAPEIVDMSKATRDMPEGGRGPLSRDPGGPGPYSPSGIFGDATLATRAKGEQVVEAMVTGILKEIEDTRTRPLPAARETK
jgi:creatinine amidohydrolase